jgi:hypothetical protein
MFLRAAIILFILFSSSACLARPSESQLSNADFGLALEQSECEKLATSHIRRALINPHTAKIYNYSECENWISFLVARHDSGYVAGKLISVMVKAENRAGIYIESQKYTLLLRGRDLVAMTKGKCSRNGYAYTFCHGGTDVVMPDDESLKDFSKLSNL